MINDLGTFLFPFFCALFSCGAAVVSYLNAKKPASVELQGTVDELVSLVEKMMKESRKEKMSRVRSSGQDTGAPVSSSVVPQGSVSGNAVNKQELRERLRSRMAGMQ